MKIPPVQKIPFIRGDSGSIVASLVREGVPYTPPTGSAVIFTAKRSAEDSDLDALFQKVLDAGLTVAGTTATVTVVPNDTVFAVADTEGYYCDIQVQEPSGAVVTPWLGKIVFTGDITRELTPSLPIYTENPPLPGGAPTPTYTHIQTIPSLLWIVNHNLGVIVATTVFDTAGNEVEAEVANPTLNQTRISFSTATAGKARCQ